MHGRVLLELWGRLWQGMGGAPALGCCSMSLLIYFLRLLFKKIFFNKSLSFLELRNSHGEWSKPQLLEFSGTQLIANLIIKHICAEFGICFHFSNFPSISLYIKCSNFLLYIFKSYFVNKTPFSKIFFCSYDTCTTEVNTQKLRNLK